MPTNYIALNADHFASGASIWAFFRLLITFISKNSNSTAIFKSKNYGSFVVKQQNMQYKLQQSEY